MENPTSCLRCGRTLKTARSIATGYGPTCARKIRTAARDRVATQYKPHQVAKAEELIEMGGLVPTRRPHVFDVVGSKGNVYKVSPTGCTCPAGLRGIHACYHRVAAEMVTVTLPTVRLSVMRPANVFALAA